MSIGSNGSGNGHPRGLPPSRLDVSLSSLDLAGAAPVRRGDPRPSEAGLTPEEKETVIQALAAGAGRRGACAQLGITSRQLAAAVVGDPGFGVRVRDAERSCEDNCMLAIYGQAMDGSIPAAVAYVKLSRDERAAREAIRQGRERLRLQGRVADHYTALPSGASGVGQMGFDLRNLADDEMHTFGDLLENLAAGIKLTVDESVMFSQLFIKVVAPSRPALEAGLGDTGAHGE